MVNKKKMIIVVSAIALVAATSAGIYSMTKNANTVSNEIAYTQIADEDVPLGIKDSFDNAIKSYYKDGLSYDEMIAKIETDLKEYVDSTGDFTPEQSDKLNAVVREYLNDSIVYPDTEKNDEAIKAITALINERYTQNYNYIASVEQSIKNIAKTDDDRYKELTDMDKRLRKWLDDSAETQRNDLSEAKKSMTDYTNLTYNKSHEELTTTTEDLKTLIDDLANTAKSDNSSTYELIKTVTGAKDFDSSKTYNKGDIIISGGLLYMATADGVNNLSDFEAADLNTSMLTLNREFNSSIDEMKIYVDKLNATTNERIDTLEVDFNADIDALAKSTEAYINEIKANLDTEDENILLYVNSVEEALNASKVDTETYVTNLQNALKALDEVIGNDYDDLLEKTNDLRTGLSSDISTVVSDLNSYKSTTDDKFNSLTNKDAALEKSISDNAALSASEREALLSEINSLKQEISELKADMQENYINKNDLTFSVNGDDLTITKNY